MKKRDVILLILFVLIDQVSKYFIFTFKDLNIEIIKNFFYISQVKNTGAAWGMFSGYMWLFYIVSIFALVYIAKIYFSSLKRPTYLRISLVMLMAGTIGNFIDRLFLGYVRDFLDFYIFTYDYPLFNVADMLLVIGVILCGLYIVLNPDEEIL